MPSFDRRALAQALGARLLACRLRPDRLWSQEACWVAAGLSRAQWQRLENGRCLPQGRTWVALCQLFPELASEDEAK